MILQYKADNEELKPTRAHKYDAGLDLRASSYYLLCKRTPVLVDTGVSFAIPPGFVGLLVARSSLHKRNIMLANNIGVIDSEYRGNILVPLIYLGEKEDTYKALESTDLMHIDKDERIAQLLVVPIVIPTLQQYEGSQEDWETSTLRGSKGFGSSGT